MASARGANKAQSVGRARAGGDHLKQNGRNKGLRNMQRQVAEYQDLVARFRAKTAPPAENDSENEENSTS